MNRSEFLIQLWRQGIAAVDGRERVKQWLLQHPQDRYSHIIAIGKAASAMMQGALDVTDASEITGLVISKDDHISPSLVADSRLTCIESSHPIPDQRSLNAGQLLLSFIADASAEASFWS